MREDVAPVQIILRIYSDYSMRRRLGIMKLGIFAASRVGYGIIKGLVKNNADVRCLIVDEKDDMCSQIVTEGKSFPIYYNSNLEDPAIYQFLKKMSLDLGILAWWPYIVKKPVIDLFSRGIINTHPSFLPYNRGKHYYLWNIVEQVPFGVSIHYVDKNIDHGDIAYQEKIEVSWEDRGVDLWEKSQDALIQLFHSHIDEILSGEIPRIKQNHEMGSFHYGREAEQLLKIDLEKNYRARDLINILRGFSGFRYKYPYFYDGEEKYCINIRIKRDRSDSQSDKYYGAGKK